MFFWILILAGLFVRIIMIFPPETFDGDGAVCGLMAKHIFEGKDFPIYFWRAHYAGTLSSYIGALLFNIFGVSYLIYRYVGVFLSFCWVLFTFILSKDILNKYGSIASLIFVLFPPFIVLHYSLHPGGIYPETLSFGTLLLLLLVKWSKVGLQEDSIFYPLLGFFSGLGLWLTPGMVPFILTIFTVFFIKDKKIFFSLRFVYFILAFFIGFLPSIIYNIQHPMATFFRMAGRILNVDRRILFSPHPVSALGERMFQWVLGIPASFARIPLMFSSLTGPISTLVFFTALFLLCQKKFFYFLKNKNADPVNILVIYTVWFILFYSVLVGEKAIRYVVPLYVVFPIFVSKLLMEIEKKSRFLSFLVLILLVSYNSYNIAYSFKNRPVHHYPQLAQWLLTNNFLYGYSDYWIAYPVIFESKERILISPTIFNKDFSDRNPEYTKKVRAQDKTVYIFDSTRHREKITSFEEQLRNLNVRYKKNKFKEFIIFSNFSRKIYPEEFKYSFLENR